MFDLTRRDILKGMAASGAMLPMMGINRAVFGATSSRSPILVVLHLRGGCDGMNLISPASDPDFIEARISELRVAADGKDAGYQLANGPDPHIDFRLHSSAGGMAELYKGGNLAFIHACGLTNQTRSHFVATDMIDRGVATDSDLARTSSGWLTRSLESNTGARNTVQAVTAAPAVSGDLYEMTGAMALPDLGSGLAPAGGVAVANALWQLYGAQNGEVATAGRLALETMATVDVKVPRDDQGHVKPYQAENNANYDPAAEFARPLKTVAQLIKMDLGLQALTLEYGNWDTHEYQAGRFKYQVDRLSTGLAAFWNDMSAYHDRLVVITLTEFGRRLRSNKSNGTDHGRAGVMAVLGGHVAGGRFHGTWPGLKTEQLDEGVDLAVATDYRRVLTEVLNNQHGTKNSVWFPNYKHAGNLGILT
jgi:uncharacterized protein (DUF1501 family)